MSIKKLNYVNSIKKKKPMTSSQRFKIINSFKEITKH
ncbi:MAG: 50S ribosomal protein L2, partial [Candidatus Karelsulcia muelleri]